jgi:hypothetical protein
MEYAGGGDILQKIKQYKEQQKFFPEKIIWNYLR